MKICVAVDNTHSAAIHTYSMNPQFRKRGSYCMYASGLRFIALYQLNHHT